MSARKGLQGDWIVSQIASGRRLRGLAKELGCTEGALRYHAKKSDFSCHFWESEPLKPKNYDAIKAAVESGVPVFRVARDYGLTRSGVYSVLHYEKKYTRRITSLLVRWGVLAKTTQCRLCERKTKLQKHHLDYRFPEIIIWLCTKCHNREHSSKGAMPRKAARVRKHSKQ